MQIKSTATFPETPANLDGFSKFNFFFGANGSGKTTISRVVADVGSHEQCSLNWKGGTGLQVLVYNRDFVESNFRQSPVLKGIFTLEALS